MNDLGPDSPNVDDLCRKITQLRKAIWRGHPAHRAIAIAHLILRGAGSAVIQREFEALGRKLDILSSDPPEFEQAS